MVAGTPLGAETPSLETASTVQKVTDQKDTEQEGWRDLENAFHRLIAGGWWGGG